MPRPQTDIKVHPGGNAKAWRGRAIQGPTAMREVPLVPKLLCYFPPGIFGRWGLPQLSIVLFGRLHG